MQGENTQRMRLAKLDIHPQKNETRVVFFTKASSKWMKDLNLKPESARQKHREPCAPHGGGKKFLNGTHPQHQSMARHTLKTFCSSTESIRGTHRPQDGGIFTCYTSDKVLISETHEEIQKLKTQEIKLPVTRWTNGLNAVFKNMNIWPITTFKVFNVQSHQQMYIKTCLEMPPHLSE